MSQQSVDGARRAAAAALVRIHRGGWTHLSGSPLASPALTPRDRAFAGALFFGSTERLVTLDFLLRPLLSRPVEKLDVEVRAVLETGLYQMLYMRVPPSAAVNESVGLARAFGKKSAAGFINAVLRRAAASYGADGVGTGPDLSAFSFEDETQRVCVVWSVSKAVAKAVMAALPGEYDAFFAASFSKGELCLRTNTLKITTGKLAEALERQGAQLRAGEVPGCLYATLPGGVAQEPLFLEGYYHVQGEASQLAAYCVGAQPGERVLDLCAAPGGKAATLAQYMGGGKGLTACDIHPARVKLIEETFTRLGVADAEIIQNDASVYKAAFAGMDRVLCDVPCSGLGVMAQKPDLRYVDGENFDALPPLQLKLLKTASRYVKQGGRLVYSTCTIRPEENGQVVQAFLEGNKEYCLIEPPLSPRGAVVEENRMTLLPHLGGQDGFFVATMEKL